MTTNSTTFVNQVTPIIANWLNDVDAHIYEEFVSVKRYGAVGDGVTNDAAAIQSALSSGIKVIYFPPGNYLIGSTLNVSTSGQTLIGYGATITNSSVSSSGFHIGYSGSAFVKTDNVTIKGFTFVGADTGAGSTYSYAICIEPPTTNPYTVGGGCSNIRVIDCKASGHAMGIIATAADQLNIQGNTFSGMLYHSALTAGGYGVLLQTCFDSNIVNNVFKGTSTDRHAIYISVNGARTYNNDNVCKRIVIANNNINWASAGSVTGFESAVVLRSPENAKVVGNVIIGGYGCIDYAGENGNGVDISIIGNSLRLPTSGGSERACITFLPSGSAFVCTGVTISGNNCIATGTNTLNISMLDCNQVSIQGNTLNQTNGTAVISLGGNMTNVVIGGNSIAATNTSACYLFNGSGNAKITLNRDLLDLSTTPRYVLTTTPTTLRFGYPRTAIIRANSTGTPVILVDVDSILSSVGTDANGIVATFAASVGDVTSSNMTFGSNNSGVCTIYYRSVASQAVTIGVTDFAGAALPSATNTYDITIQLFT